MRQNGILAKLRIILRLDPSAAGGMPANVRSGSSWPPQVRRSLIVLHRAASMADADGYGQRLMAHGRWLTINHAISH
jgi:hypothetical protein